MKPPVVLFVTFTLFLTSCATLLSGSKNLVHIRTDPPAANISILDRHGREVFNGRSQANIHLKAGAGYFVPAKYTIKINAPGYQEKIIEIKATMNGWYFANIFIGGAIGMLIIDPATGAMWKLKNIAIDEKLDKMESATGVKLQITDIQSLPENQRNELIRIR